VIANAPVLVYGDVMVDILVNGKVTRMSPEAPTAPVMMLDKVAFAPGGAANVAACVAAIGGQPHLFGMIGDDPAGQILDHELERLNIASDVLTREGRRTTAKARFVGDGRQIVRIDNEEVAPLAGADETEMLERLLDAAGKARALVISDYAKGAVTPAIASRLIMAALALDLPVVLDAKAPAAPHFRGATVVKPNLKEIAGALRRPEPETDHDAGECAQTLRRAMCAAAVVLTRGPKGVCLAADPGELHIAGHAVTAVDVTGAGDAVAAGLALALASGAGIVEAARFANAAGAVAVTKRGTVAPTFDEVEFFYDCDRSWPRKADQGMAGEGAHGRLH
jgi:D-beta-D-heptose 7-phosphate kinase/D-beta-D-heptose 1-phosphate adenosyltransferase